jgi:transposase
MRHDNLSLTDTRNGESVGRGRFSLVYQNLCTKYIPVLVFKCTPFYKSKTCSIFVLISRHLHKRILDCPAFDLLVFHS